MLSEKKAALARVRSWPFLFDLGAKDAVTGRPGGQDRISTSAWVGGSVGWRCASDADGEVKAVEGV